MIWGAALFIVGVLGLLIGIVTNLIERRFDRLESKINQKEDKI